MSQDGTEANLIDYARYHGLTLEHTLEDIDDIEFFVPPHGNIDDALRDPDGAPPLLPDFHINPERLALAADACRLLAHALRPQEDAIASDEVPETSSRTAKSRKLELPLLRTDHELDILSCKWKQQPASFGKVKFDLIPVDEENDEGLQWPQKYLKLPQEYAEKCKNERLVVTREDALRLRDQLILEDSSAPIDEIMDREVKRGRMPKPLTPPMSPPSRPPSERIVPSDHDIHDYLMLSPHTSPTVHLQKAVDEELMHRDEIDDRAPQDEIRMDDLASLFSPLKSDQVVESSSSPTELRGKRLKLEPPLTPSRVSSSIHDTASSDDLQALVPRTCRPPNEEYLQGSDADLDMLFDQTFADSAERAKRLLNDEKLIEADSTTRLPLPNIDHPLPVLPWEASNIEAQQSSDDKELLAAIKHMKMHKLSTGFERELPWNPLPSSFAPPDDDESIDYRELVEEFTCCLTVEEAAIHQTLSWKADGLRLLDDDDSDDDQLEAASFGGSDEFGGLLLKRKHAMDDKANEKQRSDNHQPPAKALKTSVGGRARQPLQDMLAAINEPSKSVKPTSDDAVHASPLDLFSASNELSHFMDLQSGLVQDRQKLWDPTSHQAKSPVKTVESVVPPPRELPHLLQAPTGDPLPSSHSPDAIHDDLPVDLSMPDTTIPYPIIISSTFLTTHRPLITQLSTLHPNLQLIERDFAGLERANFSPPKQAAATSNANAAPDLIISPRTCVILTTMQKVKQKPLPGQASLSPLRKRVVEVGKTCERLVVLVAAIFSESASNDGKETDERDTLALCDIISFSSSLSCSNEGGDVEILQMPSTDSSSTSARTEEQTAQYILSVLALESPSPQCSQEEDSPYELLQDDTTWEIFLRRAGLNAFAAQVVLGALKEPAHEQEGVDQDSIMNTSPMKQQGSSQSVAREQNKTGRGVYGLPAFVLMGAEERKMRFAGMLGGVRVLDSVSKYLDWSWRT